MPVEGNADFRHALLLTGLVGMGLALTTIAICFADQFFLSLTNRLGESGTFGLFAFMCLLVFVFAWKLLRGDQGSHDRRDLGHGGGARREIGGLTAWSGWHDGAMADPLVATPRSSVRRRADRGSVDRALAYAVLDEAYVAHVGFVVDGTPRVLPMTYGRIDDALYLHGAVGNAMLRVSHDADVCVTVTLLDGLVLARSAMHHSMNYRCVVLYGVADRVDGEAEKRAAFDAVVEKSLPGRSAAARPANASELRQTLVLRVPIAEGSVKVRTGGPVDDPDDLDLPVWAGVIPLGLVAGEPVADAAPSAGGA